MSRRRRPCSRRRECDRIFQILLLSGYQYAGRADASSLARAVDGAAPFRDEIAACSLDRYVSPETPAAFIALAGDDQAVTPENSLLYYRALMDNRVPASLHIYPEGGTRFRVQRYVPL